MTKDGCQQGNKEKKVSEVGVFIASALSEGLVYPGGILLSKVTADIRYLSSCCSSLYSDNTSPFSPAPSGLCWLKFLHKSEHILLVDVTDSDMKSKITY